MRNSVKPLLPFALLLLVPGVTLAADATTTANSDVLFKTTLNVINDFVNHVLGNQGSTNVLGSFVWRLMVVMGIVAVADALIQWVFFRGGIEIAVLTVIRIILCVTGLLFYNYLTDLLWSSVNDLGFAIQKVAIGNTDQFFVYTHIKKILSRLIGMEWDLFDKGSRILASLSFLLFSGLLNLSVTVAAGWSVIGFAFCKLVGFIFIPLAAWRQTSDFLKKMFGIMLGFLLFAFFVRVACVLVLMLYEAFLFGGFTIGGVKEPQVLQITAANVTEITLITGLGIVFVASAGPLAYILASASVGKPPSMTGVVFKLLRMRK
ncbi:hypothetical protein [Zooshikella sp. RANM57]|uniref:hypothetical protein n=1 Tax=Zooshikella sp. RANM57 TaxID=3425863 RepID=UPI003D6F9990